MKESKKIITNLDIFKTYRFDPKTDTEAIIANSPGNYIICLKRNSKLPVVSVKPTFTNFEGLQVIYTGIASVSLRTRDFRQHFKGNNAGRSTLRKSLGVLFGYKQIPRDSDPNTGKTKFSNVDEMRLSEWMCNNLIMFFLPTVDFISVEIQLINHFNPPLNLKDNKNIINSDFRRLISELRNDKEQITLKEISKEKKTNNRNSNSLAKKPKRLTSQTITTPTEQQQNNIGCSGCGFWTLIILIALLFVIYGNLKYGQ